MEDLKRKDKRHKCQVWLEESGLGNEENGGELM